MKIEGYFGNMKAAGSAVEKLKQQGFKAFIDINEKEMMTGIWKPPCGN